MGGFNHSGSVSLICTFSHFSHFHIAAKPHLICTFPTFAHCGAAGAAYIFSLVVFNFTCSCLRRIRILRSSTISENAMVV